MPQAQGDNSPAVYPGDLELQPKPPQHRHLVDSLKLLFRCFKICLCGISRFLTVLLSITVLLGILGGFVLLFVWLGMRASKPHVYVANASLTRFNLTSLHNIPDSYNLDFNLTVEIGLRNSNRRHRLCYRGIESSFQYDSRRLAGTLLPNFCQSSKTSSTVTAVFDGGSTVELEQSEVGIFENERKIGSFLLEVLVSADIRARLETTKWKYKNSVNHLCRIQVPLVVNGTLPSVGFSGVDCEDLTPQPPTL